MVEHQIDIDGVFHALSHHARRDMLSRLTSGDLTVGELAQPLAMSLAAASKHVKVLEQAGLVVRRIAGRHHVCRFAPAALTPASQWISYHEEYWAGRLHLLDQILQSESAAPPHTPEE